MVNSRAASVIGPIRGRNKGRRTSRANHHSVDAAGIALRSPVRRLQHPGEGRQIGLAPRLGPRAWTGRAIGQVEPRRQGVAVIAGGGMVDVDFHELGPVRKIGAAIGQVGIPFVGPQIGQVRHRHAPDLGASAGIAAVPVHISADHPVLDPAGIQQKDRTGPAFVKETELLECLDDGHVQVTDRFHVGEGRDAVRPSRQR